MWWKIGLLVLATAVSIFCIIPFRTHAVLLDPTDPPPKWTLWSMVSNMYLTPGTLVLIGIILAVAVLIGWRIVRAA